MKDVCHHNTVIVLTMSRGTQAIDEVKTAWKTTLEKCYLVL